MVNTLLQLKLYERARQDKYLYTIWGRDVTNVFKKDIRERIDSQRNISIEIWGEQGTGKSYSGLTLAYNWIGTNAKWYFYKDDVIKNLNLVKPPFTCLLDEQNESGNFGLGSWRIATEYEGFLETMRKRQISFINCCPVSKILPICNYGIETFYIDTKTKLVNAILYDRDGRGLGRIKIEHPENYMNLGEYENDKDAFLDKILHKSDKDRYSIMGSEFLRSPTWIKIENDFKVKNPNKEIPLWIIEQSLCEVYPQLNRNIEILELVNVVRYQLYKKGGGMSGISH
jgi:hypothetical protein